MRRVIDYGTTTKWLLHLLPVLMAASVIAFAFGGYTVLTRAHDVCNVANQDRTVLRNLLTLAQRSSKTSLKNNPAQLARAQAFYTKALVLVTPVNCKKI